MSPVVYALDTSVSVPLLMESHPRYPQVRDWARGKRLSLTGHSLAETYSVLTRLHGDAAVTPGDAVRLMDRFGTPLVLSAEAGRTVHHTLALAGISGGATYDGLVALAARENGATLVTGDIRAVATYDALGADTLLLRFPD